ncbi:MAG TPA: sulfur relay protein DsrC [Gammaproteobacteria bacterium]
MKTGIMQYLSEILLAQHEIESFEQLVAAVRRHAATERFLHMDIKPPFFDTPENWEDVLEAAFTGVASNNADD